MRFHFTRYFNYDGQLCRVSYQSSTQYFAEVFCIDRGYEAVSVHDVLHKAKEISERDYKKLKTAQILAHRKEKLYTRLDKALDAIVT